ncbi:MAG: hypothetical protein ABEK59_12815, partial [Halobacteria archaeon]
LPEFPQELRPEDQFCIYLGYIDRPREITQDDLKFNRLLRCFVGVVDTIQFTGSGTGGVTIKVEARDRVKWLMDSEIYYQINDGINPNQRSDLILDITRRSVGDIRNSDGEKTCQGCGIEVQKGETVDPQKGSAAIPEASKWYDEDLLDGQTVNKGLSVPESPKMNIFTSRTLDQYEKKAQYLLRQQYPTEMLRFLANQEVYPTELFQDNRDGNFYYTPRSVDIDSLEDNTRFRRTYYFKVPSEDLTLDINQKPINFREEKATLATKTDFLIQNGGTADQGGQQYMVHFKAVPYELRNKNFACKYKRVKDPSIQKIGEAAMVAMSPLKKPAPECLPC